MERVRVYSTHYIYSMNMDKKGCDEQSSRGVKVQKKSQNGKQNRTISEDTVKVNSNCFNSVGIRSSAVRMIP